MRTERAILMGSVVLLFITLRINPDLVSFTRTPSKKLDVLHSLVIENESTGLGNITSTYRGGPSRNGRETTPTSLHLKLSWQSEPINHGIHGASKSSPAVDESGLYVGSDTGWFYHFDFEGKVVWKFHVDQAEQGIHGSALLDDQHVYFGAYNGRLYCLRKSDGQLIWVNHLAEAIGSSPVADGNYLYVSAETANSRDGRLFKIEKKTGETVWISDWFDEQIHSSPTLSLDLHRVFVGCNSGTYSAYDIESGQRIWEFNTFRPVKGTAALSSDQQLYVSSWSKRIYKIDAKTGRLRWQTQILGTSQSSPTLFENEGLLVVASSSPGIIYGIQLADGHIRWQIKTGVDRMIGSASAIRALENGRDYAWMACHPNQLCAIDPQNGKVAAQTHLPNPLTGVPVSFRGHLFVALDNGPLLDYAPTAQVSKAP